MKSVEGFQIVIEGTEKKGHSALLPKVLGFFVADSTIEEIERKTRKALPWYLDYLRRVGKEVKTLMLTEQQLALTVPSPHEELQFKHIKIGVL